MKSILEEAIRKKCGVSVFEETCIDDATDAAKVRSVFGAVPCEAHLHYTGGTKIMAAHARMAFREAGGKDEQASYLDERRGLLRFDHGHVIDLAKERLALTLFDVLELHGIEPKKKRQKFSSDKILADAKKIRDNVLKSPQLAGHLFRIHRENQKKRRSLKTAKQQPVSMKDLGLDLSVCQVPENDWNREQYEEWCDFLGGGWLEIWCGSLVQDIARERKVLVGLHCERAGGRQFEIDVAFVRDFRFYVMSCTTSTKVDMCKSKLFEVAMRARQMGGDLARSCLVCLLHGSDSSGVSKVDQLRNDVADIWDAPNTPRVFALDDLKEWAGIDGPKSTRSLEEWLDS